jgi:membrane dipeptidase
MTLTRRNFLELTSATGVAALTAPGLLAAPSARELYDSGIVIDGMGFPGGRQQGETSLLNALELEDIAVSGLTAAHFTVGAVGTMPALEALAKIVTSVAEWEGQIAAHPELLQRVRKVSDIDTAKASGRTGLVYGLQDGVAFEDDVSRLKTLWQLGIRVIQPTYNRRNLLGDGCMEPANAGLSRNGLDAIGQMNELGILVDLSHCGRQTTADAIAASSRPVSFTHTGCYSLAEHPRHRTDAEIRAVAETGGVIGIFIMPYLSKGLQPTAADVIAHLEHALNVAGEDHVSLGTDGTVSPQALTPEFIEEFRKTTLMRKELGIAAPFETEEGYLFANDLNTPRRFETLAELLLERGHSARVVEKILGGNLLRVFADTWSTG